MSRTRSLRVTTTFQSAEVEVHYPRQQVEQVSGDEFISAILSMRGPKFRRAILSRLRSDNEGVLKCAIIAFRNCSQEQQDTVTADYIGCLHDSLGPEASKRLDLIVCEIARPADSEDPAEPATETVTDPEAVEDAA
jgi:hypothetical protein